MLKYIYIIVLTLLTCTTTNGQTINSARNIAMGTHVAFDATIDSIVRVYSDSLTACMGRHLGQCTETMISRRPESPLMRFVADALMFEGIKMAKDKGLNHPIVTLSNAGGIRADLREGEITVRNIYEIAPFENKVVMMVLTPRQLRDVAYHIASRGGEAIAGWSFRLEDGTAKRIKVHEELIDKDKMYTLITVDYLATGGDQFKCLTNIPVVASGRLFREVLTNYIESISAQGKDIVPPMDERITLIRSQY
ncbi:MAG: 5'-nucleotidase C-terminal domain-containing protein [Bacteroidales bacterium]|nr:5'-nucleotidase C-terminal domain-containing protein [Bacteroidales bacterium]